MLAIIDLGTNSARLLVGQKTGQGLAIYRRQRITTRLGEGLQDRGPLLEPAMARTVAALHEFQRLLAPVPVARVVVVATSAARRATNTVELAQAVTAVFRVPLRVLTGEEEGRLSFAGAVGNLPPMAIGKQPVVADIGGGSTELATWLRGEFQAVSLAVGALRCTEGAMSAEAIRRALVSAGRLLAGVDSPVLVGVGGTITSLAALDLSLRVYDPRRVSGHVLSLAKVGRILNELTGLSPAARRQLVGLEPARADLIVVGTKILHLLMQELQADAITVSDADLMEGLLMEAADCRQTSL